MGQARRSAGRRHAAIAVVVLVVLGVLGSTGSVGAGIFPPPGGGTGSISGVVTGPGGEPLEGAVVYVDGGSFGEAETGPDGSYVVEGLRAGYYVVAFVPPAGSTLAGEYYDDTYTAPTPVEVADETDTPGIDAELAEGTTLSGTVSDPDGQPFEGAEVYVERWGVGYTGGPLISGSSGADGSFQLHGLAPGYYRLQIVPPFTSDLQPQYYDGVYAYYEATPLRAEPPAPITGIDVQLETGGSISGTVVDGDGAPLPDVEVYAQGSDFGNATTAADGTYTLEGLRPGTYVVQFVPGGGLLPEFFDNVTSFSEATPVPVVAGAATGGIDAALDEGAAVAGQVVGLDGLPDSGVQVWATSPAGAPLQVATTNFAGQYFLNGLPTGDVLIEFREPFNTQYWDGVYRRSEATPVPLVAGQETTGIDAVFEAILIGTQLVGNDTTVETYCLAGDPLTFVFDVTDLDPAGGVTGGSIDFGDGTTPWAFDAAGDTVSHTFPNPAGVPTPPAYEVTMTLTGGSGGTDSVSFMPGATDCRVDGSGQIFSDVPPSSPFYAAIEWMAVEGITSGFADGTFRPKLSVTREGVASWLYEFAGAPPVSGPQEFSDVPPSSPFYAAIQWMAQEGITSGFADGTFRPKLSVTREGVASWLYEFAGAPPVSGPQEFSDVPPSSPFYAAIQWMAQEGITSGFADGTFRPKLDITREGAAAWLHQYDQTLP